jgi:hypothetical protein
MPELSKAAFRVLHGFLAVEFFQQLVGMGFPHYFGRFQN